MSASRWTVECVCTNRGAHKRTWLGRMIWDAPWSPTDEQRAGYRAALTNNAAALGDTVDDAAVDELVSGMGHGGWRTFLPVPGPDEPDLKHETWFPPLASAAPGEFTSHHSYGMSCPRCSRSPRYGQNLWFSLLNEAREAARDELDVSHLD